jgi:3-hydroxyisobutyrate dehydrogenase
METKVGFLGLGAMGSPIASRLAKKFRVTVWNRTRQRALDHSESYKTQFVANYQDLGDMDYIFACLPSSRVSNEIFLDLHKLQPIKTTFIDITSGDYESSVELSKKLHPRRYFDAPVSGGPKGAKDGTLTTMAGSRNLSSNDQLVISAYSKSIFPCGDIGHGNAIKGANNFLNMTHLILASDVLLQLSKKGICPDLALRAINASSGRSLQTEVRIPSEVLTRKFNYGFKLNLMRKDIFQNEEILKDGLFFSRIKELLAPHGHSEEDYTTIVKDLENIYQRELKKKDQ